MFLLLPGISLTRAQDVAVRAVLDTNSALIGDQLRLRLTAEVSLAGLQVGFPVLRDSLSNQIEILKISSIDTTQDHSKQILSQELLITVFDTGFIEVPALPFSVEGNNINDTLLTLPLGFEVASVKADSTIRDIKAIYRAPVGLREILPYGLALMGGALLAWFIIRYLKKRQLGQQKKVRVVSSEPPDIIAIRELEKLKDEKPWMNNKVKYYYIRISEILRLYLENRYCIQALEQTTDEILFKLKSAFIEPSDFNNLANILKLADLVKFAKVIPDAEENILQIDYAKAFVRNSTASFKEIVPAKNSELVTVENNRPT